METAARPITVWIVEDDGHFRETLEFLVTHTSGMRSASSFPDCEAALEAAASAGNEAPDVVLLDINLPGLSGLEGLSRLKTRLPRTRIVMLTIVDDADTIFEALRSGASGYLLKNAPVDHILDAVRAAHRGGTLMPAPVADRVLGFFRKTAPSTDYGLTGREQEILQEMGAGYSQKEIAARLFVSPHTVNTHIQHIYEKLHVRSGVEAVAKALREHLIR